MNFKKLAFGLLIMGLLSCSRKNDEIVNINAEKLNVETTIRNAIGWAQTKDINLLYSIISNDSGFIEIHPGPGIVKGFNEFRKAEIVWLSPEFRAVRYSIWDLHITISHRGEVAWWFCMLDDVNELAGQPAAWENTRWTGVAEKQDGQWKIVQQHFSFACPNK
jgi:ketosteroid isomerase-like protein